MPQSEPTIKLSQLIDDDTNTLPAYRDNKYLIAKQYKGTFDYSLAMSKRPLDALELCHAYNAYYSSASMFVYMVDSNGTYQDAFTLLIDDRGTV